MILWDRRPKIFSTRRIGTPRRDISIHGGNWSACSQSLLRLGGLGVLSVSEVTSKRSRTACPTFSIGSTSLKSSRGSTQYPGKTLTFANDCTPTFGIWSCPPSKTTWPNIQSTATSVGVSVLVSETMTFADRSLPPFHYDRFQVVPSRCRKSACRIN